MEPAPPVPRKFKRTLFVLGSQYVLLGFPVLACFDARWPSLKMQWPDLILFLSRGKLARGRQSDQATHPLW
jgi:hypothetical protein